MVDFFVQRNRTWKKIMHRTLVKACAVDAVTGLVAFALLLVFVAVSARNDLQLFCAVSAVLFFCAGLIRGGRDSAAALLTGLIIAFAGTVSLLLLRQTGAFTEHGYTSLFVVFALVMSFAGAAVRQLALRGRVWAASTVVFASLIVTGLATALAIPALMARWSFREVNNVTPDFSFVTLDGKTTTSNDLRGRVVVLAFWASWCTPCQQELPEMQRFYEANKNNSNLIFYALGGPWGDDTIDKEIAFAKRFHLKLPLAFDREQTTRQRLGIVGFPGLLILDANGRVRMTHDGYDASEHLADQVSKKVQSLSSN